MRLSAVVGTVFFSSLAALAAAAPADCRAGESCAAVTAEIKSVALFKNGQGFFTSQAALPEGSTEISLGQLPVPAYGTFWVSYPREVEIRQIVTGIEEVEAPSPAQSLPHLLHLNPGKPVTLWTGTGEEREIIQGTVVEVVQGRGSPEPRNPYVMGGGSTGGANPAYSHTAAPPGILLVKTGDGVVSVSAGSIHRIDFGDNEVKAVQPAVERRPFVRVELDRPAPKSELTLTYLAKGITWVPSYVIDLSDPERARLSAKALIINEVADLEDVTLELITGFPNIAFGDVRSPAAMSEKLADFLNALTGDRTQTRHGGSRGQMATQQALIVNAPVYDPFPSSPSPGYSTAEEGTVSEDLFFYPARNLSLKKNETAYLPLFTAEMPYSHLYTWKIDDYLDEQGRYRTGVERQDGKLAEEVWHSCRLENSLKMPLTTASAEFVKEGRFVGQDVCYYTAPGAKTTIRINRAMNILAEQAEFEVEREQNAATFHGHRYDLVKVRGELRLRSRLDRTVKVEITKELSGEVNGTDPEATVVKTAKGLKQVNPKHRLVWNIDLDSGRATELTYRYQVYVRY